MMPIRRAAESTGTESISRSCQISRTITVCGTARCKAGGRPDGRPLFRVPTSLAAAPTGRPFPCARAGASPVSMEVPMPRRLSGFKPTGHLHLGNLLGAIRPAIEEDSVILVCDLHALTVEHDPREVRALTREVATLLLAAG